MEEPAAPGCGCLLQLARRGDRNDTRGGHRDHRLAVGTRGAETERYPFDASGDGMPIDRRDLRGVVHPCENPAETTRGPARIPLADRGGGRSHRRADWTPRRLSQWSEWTRIEVFQESRDKGGLHGRHPREALAPPSQLSE